MDSLGAGFFSEKDGCDGGFLYGFSIEKAAGKRPEKQYKI